jgi:hypothetical protein
MSDDPAEKTALVQAIESGVVDAVREAVESAGDADAQRAAVNAEAPGTWHASLHTSASLGDVEVTKLLLELGADPNAEDIKGRTCLHCACDAYSADETSHPKFEATVEALVEGGALSLEDVAGNLPDAGDDAGAFVRKALDRAFADGAERRASQKEDRKAKRKAKMDAIFSGKLQQHVNNASAVAITVMDSGDRDGYKRGSRG